MNFDNLKYYEVIKNITKIKNNHLQEINTLLLDKELQKVFKVYTQNIEDHKNSGFNIFNLISEKYYYENLHSDIISMFLDITAEHNEGSKFLYTFIQLLQKLKPCLEINFKDFSNSTAKRENDRIDILIQDCKTQKAILIENKINNAPDTYRQLPTYVSKVGERNVVAIVYLPLKPEKVPVKQDWETEEINFINSKLICLPAFNRTEHDFFHGWLQPCIKVAGSDCSEILKQYSKLIQKIGGFIMDKKLFEDFYTNVVKDTITYKNLLSIKSILDDFPKYLAMRIVDKFTHDSSPFKKIHNSGNDAIFERISIEKLNFDLRITCEIDKFKFKFWDLNFAVDKLKNTEIVIKQLGYNTYFKDYGDNELVRIFNFPEEEQDLYDFISEFKRKLDTSVFEF